MKMRNVNINLTIPNFIPSMYKISRTLKTWKFKLFPFHCQDCNISINYKRPIFSYRGINARSCMIQSITHEVCGDCLAIRIENMFNSKHTENRICECCNKRKQTMMEIRDKHICDIVFGVNYWNGQNVCKECLMRTSMFGARNSSMYENDFCINEAGALIPVERKK